MKQGWQIKKLGDLYPLKTGRTPSRGDASLWDTKKATNNLWVSIADISANEGKAITDTKEYISDKACDKFPMVPEGTLLVSFKLSLGRMSFVGKALRTNEAILSLSPISEINQRFLYYYFLFFDWDKAAEGDVKVKGKTLNQKKLAEIPILYPSISEQQRIVNLLDVEFAKIDALKANAEKNLQNAKDLFQAALKKELEPKKDWKVQTLKDIGLTQTGTTPKTSVKGNYGDFIPFIKPADVNIDGLGNLNYNNEGLSEQGAKSGRVFDANSILMVCIGATIGKVGYAKQRVSSNQQINVLTPYNGYDSKFLYYCMASPSFQFEVIKEGESAKATLPIINKSKWESLSIATPTIADQQYIVARLDALNEKCNALQANYEKTLNLCDDLKQALLRKAFNGEI